ncbi:MAG: tRNA pseudouridine(38-40) synthase TruA [Bryobacterales bacterium]|nr:tRNA pseudouridine(38-40) synthase TruA [Bryobacterales bacterium]
MVSPDSRPTRLIKVTISYDGTDFHGWQVQPGLPTIQGTLERLLTDMETQPVHVAGSGRTDAGVHAIAQTAAFSLRNPIPVDNLRRALNRLLPPAVRIVTVEEVASSFHPRYDAVAKTYEYRIWRGEVCSPFERRYIHHHPYPLCIERMQEAAAVFIGTHDFSAFAAADDRDALGLSKVRTIFDTRLWQDGHRLLFRVRGSGFLKHMVRNMVGTLLEAGKGNLDREGLARRLEPGYQGKSGPRAPACGLFLMSVEYP